MATSSSHSMNSDLIDKFIAVTGATRNVARNLLEACAGNLDMAVGMHMDNDGVGPAVPETIPESLCNESDNVRAPIPQKTEVLIEDDPGVAGAWRMRRPRRQVPSVFDGFRDFQAEAYDYDESLRGKKPSKKRNLEDLFRPPIDITYKGTFQSARDAGSSQNKWLLVNVQNVQEFPCQLLNRDVWSNIEARSIIKKHFLFWQVYNDSEEGKRFMQFYKLKQWPYVAVIDPLTGENQIVWNKISDGDTFCKLAQNFLSLSPVPNSGLASPPAKRLKREPSIIDATEQEQMEAAIQASLVENQAKPSSPQYIESDSDADLLEDSDVETFSDSDEVIVSSPPRSNGHSSSSKVSVSKQSSKDLTNPKHERLKQPLLPSSSRLPSPFSRPSSSAQSSSSNLSRVSSTLDIYPQESVGPSSSPRQNIWAGSSSQHTGHDAPLEIDTDSSLIDMIGSREAEVCTPDVCTLDDSPYSSQLAFDCSSDRTDGVVDEHSWKIHWGNPEDPVSKILMRYPENKREQIELPNSSKLKALFVLCAAKGFSADKFELVTNFPRRKLSQMDGETTLKEIGLYPQETVFVQDI
ncbi:UBX domain-containing protein 7-like [Biomphalaria glabrata]|uniref:UBX domain-containing protein 7-like n=1 Tax=Biomphalaria glabrata TaxID=6526 RepID=A0A9W3A7G8_BIOGL|nr:UBX domain-containing protein 7-like [Biomphalaria glabrata]